MLGSRILRLGLVAIAASALAGCGTGLACPQYRTFSGIYLDYSGVALSGLIRGQLCLDASCQPLPAWLQVGKVAPGRVRLDLPSTPGVVQLRVVLTDSSGRRFVQSRAVSLLPYYGAGRSCLPTGYTREVRAVGDELVVKGGAPAWR